VFVSRTFPWQHQSIPRSSVRFRLKPENSNSHGFELHRPSIKGTKLLLKAIKAIKTKEYTRATDTKEDWATKKEAEKENKYSSFLGFINHLIRKGKSGWKATQINFTTGVRGFLHTNQFLTRLETLGVKYKNTRQTIRNRTVQKTFSMSDIILKFFSIALNSKIDWTLQSLTTEITITSMQKYNLYLQATGPP